MAIIERMSSLASLAIGVAAAVVLSTVVRAVTIEATQTVGQVWPFSLTACKVATTPGCDAHERPANRLAAGYGTYRR